VPWVAVLGGYGAVVSAGKMEDGWMARVVGGVLAWRWLEAHDCAVERVPWVVKLRCGGLRQGAGREEFAAW